MQHILQHLLPTRSTSDLLWRRPALTERKSDACASATCRCWAEKSPPLSRAFVLRRSIAAPTERTSFSTARRSLWARSIPCFGRKSCWLSRALFFVRSLIRAPTASTAVPAFLTVPAQRPPASPLFTHFFASLSFPQP